MWELDGQQLHGEFVAVVDNSQQIDSMAELDTRQVARTSTLPVGGSFVGFHWRNLHL